MYSFGICYDATFANIELIYRNLNLSKRQYDELMRHYLLLDLMIVLEGQIWEIANYYLSIKVMFMHMFSITKGQQEHQFSSVQRRTSKCMHRH